MKKGFGLIICLFVSSNLFSQVTSVALGVAVQKLSDQLNQVIENAKNAGLNLEIEAGRQVAISLENFKNVYTSSMNLTFNKLDTTVTNQFESLKSLTDQVQRGAVTSITDVTERAQQIANTLPFHSHQPHLRAFTPTYIVPSTHNYDVTIVCSGNFEKAGAAGYNPTLKLGNTIYPSGGGNQNLEFHIPIADFMKLNGIEKNSFGYVKCELSVPWDYTYGVIFHTKKIDKYTLYLGTLPKQPGIITLLRTINSTIQKDSVVSTSPPHRQSSCSDGGNSDKKDVPWVDRPTPGWTVVKGTSSIRMVGGQGDHGWVFITDDGNLVQYNVSTFHHGVTGGPSGCVDFVITFTERIAVPKQTVDTIPVDINWGDSRTIDFPVGEWKVQYKAFDGTVNEFAGDDSSDPFIKIAKTGMVYKISTADPSSLVWH